MFEWIRRIGWNRSGIKFAAELFQIHKCSNSKNSNKQASVETGSSFHENPLKKRVRFRSHTFGQTYQQNVILIVILRLNSKHTSFIWTMALFGWLNWRPQSKPSVHFIHSHMYPMTEAVQFKLAELLGEKNNNKKISCFQKNSFEQQRTIQRKQY